MTSSDIFNSTRFLLHDGDRQSATGSHFYSPESIERAYSEALAVLMRELIMPKDPKTGLLLPRVANLSVGPLAASYAPVWVGAASARSAPLPNDFFILEAGLLPSGGYVPVARAAIGETIAASSLSKLYAFSGNLYGPEASRVYYFRQPPRIVAGGRTPLARLSDAVFHCAKYAACRDLVRQHSKSAWWRWSFFDNEYQSQKGSLQ